MTKLSISPYFENYLRQVPETNVFEAFKNQQPVIDSYFENITEENSKFAYAEGKWSIKEMMQHVIDTERIMAYRALCFARGEKISLPGFDENAYVSNSFANKREWRSLVEELKTLRISSVQMFRSFDSSSLENVGHANSKEMSPELMGLIMVGHIYHHKRVIEERYFGVQ